MSQITDAVDKGATLRTGGKRLDRPGAFVEPTVLTDVTPDMRANIWNITAKSLSAKPMPRAAVSSWSCGTTWVTGPVRSASSADR